MNYIKKQITLTVLLYFFILIQSSAQIITPFEYEFPDEIPLKYQYSPIDSYNKTIATLQKNKDKNLINRTKIFAKYAQYYADKHIKLIHSGEIYFNWDELEDYVNQVFKKIAPAEIANDTSYHVYITRDPDFNAWSEYNNRFYITIGLISQIRNEAMLACILAHELGHYINYHAYNRYALLKKQKTQKEWRDQEREADQYAMELIPKTGYSLSSFKDFFLLSERIAKRAPTFIEFWSPITRSTHPSNKERVEQIENVVKNSNHVKGQENLVNQELLKQIQKKARYQMLTILLEIGHYHQCVKQAFEYHLQDPDNQHAIYFILEGIRRWQVFTPKIAEQMFVTESSFNHTKASLLENFNKDILVMSPDEIKESKASVLIDPAVIEFKTYGEAFEYFSKIAEKIKCVECKLTSALYYSSNQNRKTELLKNYIKDNGKHQLYANAFLSNELEINSNKRSVLLNVCTDDLAIISNKLTNVDYKNSKQFIDTLQTITSSIIKNNLSTLHLINNRNENTNFKQTNLLKRLNNTFAIFINNNPYYSYDFLNEKLNYKKVYTGISKIKHELVNPAIWEYCYQNGVNELSFLDVKIQFIKNYENIQLKDFYTRKSCIFKFEVKTLRYWFGKETKSYSATNFSYPRELYNITKYSGIINTNIK